MTMSKYNRGMGVLALAVVSACGSEPPAIDPVMEDIGVAVSALHAWNGFHWARTGNPFSVPLGDNLTATIWRDLLVGAVSPDWSASTVLDTSVVPGGSTRKTCSATSGRVEICNRPYGFNRWLGLATIWSDSLDHILQATVKLNDTYFGTSYYNDQDARRHVLCQEVGHTLGLDHQMAASCMDDRNGLKDPSYTRPNAHDYEELEIIYGNHGDASSSTTTSIAQRPSGQPPGLFVRNESDGTRAFTWVIWAAEDADER